MSRFSGCRVNETNPTVLTIFKSNHGALIHTQKITKKQRKKSVEDNNNNSNGKMNKKKYEMKPS